MWIKTSVIPIPDILSNKEPWNEGFFTDVLFDAI